MKKKLKKGGILYLFLPAKMLLWSKMDEQVGHYRRYEIKDLKKKCEIAGLKIEALHYADRIGFFASFAIKLFGYNKISGIGSLSSLKFYDEWIFPFSKFLDSIRFIKTTGIHSTNGNIFYDNIKILKNKKLIENQQIFNIFTDYFKN